MACAQLQLFPPARPLLEKLGADFFRKVPSCPGVYVMTGVDQRVLYIGQSRNLHKRLGTYKNIKTDASSRKLVRLAHQLTTITWETCLSPQSAMIRENQLLRLHRPRFNVVNTFPAAYNFLWLRAERSEIELGRGTNPPASAQSFGAFKGAVRVFGSLLRLVWVSLAPRPDLEHAPALLLSTRPPRSFTFRTSAENIDNAANLRRDLELYLRGESEAVLELFRQNLDRVDPALVVFLRLLQEDLEALTLFYRVGTRRNFQLRTRYDLPTNLIPQQSLDDLLVLEFSGK